MTGPLGRMKVRAVGKRPNVESVDAIVREQHQHIKKLVKHGLARHMLGVYKGVANGMCDRV